MAKKTIEEFIEKVKLKHGDKYDFSESNYQGLNKEITYKCPIHGEVTQLAKKILTHSGCPICDQEKAKKNRQSGSYSRNKGHNYEQKIARELRELGYDGVVTSRSQSKRLDDMKIDLVDINNKLPFYCQLKCTSNIPNYFKIRSQCPLTDKPFVLFFNRQEVKDGQINMSSVGELVMLDKSFFYKLLKKYE